MRFDRLADVLQPAVAEPELPQLSFAAAAHLQIATADLDLFAPQQLFHQLREHSAHRPLGFADGQAVFGAKDLFEFLAV